MDWQGPINYYRNLPLARSADRQLAGGECPVEALLLVGNLDPQVSLDLVSQSAQYVTRSASPFLGGIIF